MNKAAKAVRRKPDLEQWRQLYEVADALRELAP